MAGGVPGVSSGLGQRLGLLMELTFSEVAPSSFLAGRGLRFGLRKGEGGLAGLRSCFFPTRGLQVGLLMGELGLHSGLVLACCSGGANFFLPLTMGELGGTKLRREVGLARGVGEDGIVGRLVGPSLSVT